VASTGMGVRYIYNIKNMEKKSTLIIAATIVIGLVLGSFILGKSFERFRKEDRYISVKGFAEREVKADLAIWSIKVRIAYNDLQEGSRSIDVAKNKVIQFLIKNGIDPKEIIQRDLTVSDKQADQYSAPNSGEKLRYIIEETIEVRSNNVDNIQNVSRMTSELLGAGVALSTRNDWQGGGLKFLFTKLNDIKPAMLAEATRNAKSAAVQFTKESDTKLGKMRKASQGLFSIADRDEASSGQGEGGYAPAGTSDLFKKVRVVISVDYSIE
jgi:uncharacterized protein